MARRLRGAARKAAGSWSPPRRLALALAALLVSGAVAAPPGGVAVVWNDPSSGAGQLAAIGTADPWPMVHDPIPVGGDAVLHSAFGKLFVLSAAQGTLEVVDPARWVIERSYVLPPGGEPVDIQVVSPDRAYITRRGAQRLLSLDLQAGTAHETVDLSPLADGDGIPDQAGMAVHAGLLFVQIQAINFDDPSSFTPSSLAVVDLETGELVDTDRDRDGPQGIPLQGTFPKMPMQVVEQTGKLLVSSTGAFFDAGGIEVIDLERLQSEGLAIREADDQTGADLGAFVMVSPDRGFLSYSTDLLLSSHLHRFSLSEGVEPAELGVALDYFAPAIAFDPGTDSVFFPVGGSLASGLEVFDAQTGARRNDRLIPLAGSPTDLLVLAVVPEPQGGAWILLTAAAFGGWIRRQAARARQARRVREGASAAIGPSVNG